MVVRSWGRVSRILMMVMTMTRTRREQHSRGGVLMMGPGRMWVGHHPRRRVRHAVRRHVRMEIGRTADAIVLVVSWCHWRRRAAAALRSVLGRRDRRAVSLLLMMLLLLVGDAASRIRHHPLLQRVQVARALRTARIVDSVAVVVVRDAVGTGIALASVGFVVVVVVVAPAPPGGGIPRGGCGGPRRAAGRRRRHRRGGEQSPRLARTLIVVPGVALMKWVVVMMMAAKPGGKVSARRVLPVGVGVLRRLRRRRRAVVRSGMRVGRRRRVVSEVVTLRRRRHRRRSAAAAADREVRIVRRGRWMDATAATHNMVGWMMAPMIRGGWRPVAVAMRRNGRTAATAGADAARAYSGTGFVAPRRRKRRDVVSVRRRGRGMVHVMRTTVV
jgi:hypothetical protein